MADEKKTALAQQVYRDLCAALDRKDWNYEKDEEKLIIHFRVSGDDIPISMIVLVDADRQLIRVMSPMPFEIAEDKRIEGAIATCVASFGMADGNFDYDFGEGTIMFRMTASFRDSQIGDTLFYYLIDCSCTMVDKYNDQFLALNKGMLSINDFVAKNQ